MITMGKIPRQHLKNSFLENILFLNSSICFNFYLGVGPFRPLCLDCRGPGGVGVGSCLREKKIIDGIDDNFDQNDQTVVKMLMMMIM